MDIEKLKVKAYDLLIERDTVQDRFNAINKELGEISLKIKELKESINSEK